MSKLNKMMDDFMKVYDIAPTSITVSELCNTDELITEEMLEFEEEFMPFDLATMGNSFLPDDEINKANVAKEMADIVYVTIQRMRRMGMDVDAVLGEVHRSNMSKRVMLADKDMELNIARQRYPNATIVCSVDGMCVIRDSVTGKVIKPTYYSPALITEEMYHDIQGGR